MSGPSPMNDADFDAHAEEYDAMLAKAIAASGEAAEYFAEYKVRDLASMWTRSCGGQASPARNLDFGAGVGGAVPFSSVIYPAPRSPVRMRQPAAWRSAGDGSPGASRSCIARTGRCV